MKTYLTYGFAMALGGALFTLVLFFLGFHSDPAKLQTGQWISIPVLILITVVCLVLGLKARLADVPVTEDFGYGRALGNAVMIVLFAAIIGIATNLLYFMVINPGFVDVAVQAQIDKLEAKGMSGTQIEQAEKGIRWMMKPPILACFGFISGMFWGTLIALITAAFFRRPAVNDLTTAA